MVAGGGTVTSSAGFNAAVPCGGDSSPVNAADTTAISQSRKPSDTRRSNKPIMEKRRRARINNCLNELKTLILDAMKKDPARHSKLEKADILEMTVKHLEQMQRQQVALSLAADPLVVNKFRAGFNECAGEVGRFPGLDPPVRRRLLQHLGNCLNNSLLGANGGSVPVPQDPTPGGNVQLHILPTTLKDASVTINQQHQSNGGIFLSTTNSGSLQLVPTRLPNGDIALILPSSTSNGFAHSQPKSIPSSPTPSSTSSSPPPMPLLVSLPTSKPTLMNPSNAPSSSPDTFERIPKSVAYDMVSSSNYASDSSVSPTHLVNTNYGQSRKLSVDCNTDFDRISPNHEQFVNQKLVDRSSYKNYQRMSPYAKIVVDKSTFNSASNDSPSRASPTTFERLSVNIPASQNLSNDVATSPVSLQSNGSYPSPLSPSGSSTYETMSPSRCYSPPSQKPLSLVIKRESMEALDDEPCWRPW